MGESNERASWKKMGYRSRESMGGHRRKPRRDTVHTWGLGVQDRSKRKDRRERLALTNKAKGEEHLETYGGLREEIRMKT